MTTISATAFGFGADQSGITNRNALNAALDYLASLGVGSDTTLNFEDRSSSATALSGTYGSINWNDSSGSAQLWTTVSGSTGSKQLYVNSSSTSQVTQTFTLPAGKVLKTFTMRNDGYASPSGTVSVTIVLSGNLDFIATPGTSFKTYGTGWVHPSTTVTVKVTHYSGASNIRFDDLVYGDPIKGGIVTLPAGTFDILDGQYTSGNYAGSGFPLSGANSIFNNTIKLPSNCTLRGAGRDATKLVAVANSNWYLIMSKDWNSETAVKTSNSCIEELTLDGNRSNQITASGSYSSGGVASGTRLRCDGPVVRNVGVTNMVMNGIEFESSQIPITEKVHAYANGNDGVYYVGCTNLQARGIFAHDNTRGGIGIAGCEGGAVTGNICTRNQSGIVITYGIASKRITISGNNFALNSGSAIVAQTTGISDSLIVDNDCSYAGRTTVDGTIAEAHGIFLVYSDYNLIVNNKIDYVGGSGINFYECKNNKVTGNRIYGCGQASGAGAPFGIAINALSAGAAAGNTLSGNDIDDVSGSPTTDYSIWTSSYVTDLIEMYNVLGPASVANTNAPSTCPQINWLKSSTLR